VGFIKAWVTAVREYRQAQLALKSQVEKVQGEQLNTMQQLQEVQSENARLLRALEEAKEANIKALAQVAVETANKALHQPQEIRTGPQWNGKLRDYVEVFTPELELTKKFDDWAAAIRALRQQCVVADFLLNGEIYALVKHPGVIIQKDSLVTMSSEQLLTEIKHQLDEFHKAKTTIALKRDQGQPLPLPPHILIYIYHLILGGELGY